MPRLRRCRSVLRARRLALGLTQQQVAEHAGMLHGSYNNLEWGRRNPTMEHGFKIAELLGVDVQTLFRLDSTGVDGTSQGSAQDPRAGESRSA